MLNSYIVLLIPLLPFISFLLISLLGRKNHAHLWPIMGTLMVGTSALLSGYTAYNYFTHHAVNGVFKPISVLNYNWLPFSNGMSINMGLLIDPISSLMIVVVTFISLMIHIYSLGYMYNESRINHYFSFLSLFTFSMLGLVLAANLFQIYIFWELVGLSSFLLIGFYYTRDSAVAAAKKAFIVTRFADFGFLIGILILSYYGQSLDFIPLIDALTPGGSGFDSATAAGFMGISALTWGLLLVFMGGAGKSAMFPLHIWLPDAMEGPTPVSALIHAATMVVAGVFLVARMFPIYVLGSVTAMNFIVWVGIISSMFAAIIACTQTDIKRVLAYSTMSQIGYMMFSLGVSGLGGESGLGFTASMFHLFTHAIFKASLFLCAGAVIHLVHSNETTDMGGLKKYMPVTHIVFLIACLAISGIPPFAGFFSKEEILLATWHSNPPVFILALITSAVTSFYMFRLYFLIFWNKTFEGHADTSHGEAPFTMKFPLLILGIFTCLAGFVPFGNYITSDGHPIHSQLHIDFSILPVMLAVCAIAIAYRLYKNKNQTSDNISESVSGIYIAAKNRFYIDEIYQFVTHKILFSLIGKPAAWFDRNIIDGIIRLTGVLTTIIADIIRPVQSGKLQDYTYYFISGVLILTFLVMYIW